MKKTQRVVRQMLHEVLERDDWNTFVKNGRTPLHYAVFFDQSDIVRSILRTKVDKNAKDGKGFTPLHVAVAECHLSIVKLLLRAKVNTNVKDREGWTPLHSAAANGHTAIVKLLMDAGANMNMKNVDGRTPLHNAAHQGHTDIVRLLIGAGANKEVKDAKGWTPLCLAVQKDCKAVVTLLLKAGVNVNVEDKDERTPLHWAVQEGHTDIVKLLLDAGAKKEVKSKYSVTPLHWAARAGHTGILKLLLDAGANKNVRDKDDWTPLHYAARYDHTDVVKLLLDAGADKNGKISHGDTLLHLAARNGHIDIVNLLLDAGANMNVKNVNGKTPLHYAAQNGHTDVVKLLLDAGADIEVKHNSGRTALHLAAVNGYTDVVMLLLDAGSDKSLKDESDSTPLDLAKCKGHDDVIRILEQRKNPIVIWEKSMIRKACELMDGMTSDSERESFCHKLVSGEKVMCGGIDISDQKGWKYILMAAAVKGHGEIVTCLAISGADVNSASKDGRTVMMAAAIKGHAPVVAALCVNGANLNAADDYGWTAMMMAARYGQVEVVTALCEAGANIHATEKNGRTAMLIAARYGHENIVITLCDAGSDINASTQNGWTSMMYASINGHTRVVQLLCDRGADINAKDKEGKFALHIAAQMGHTEVCQVLCDAGSECMDVVARHAALKGLSDVVTLLSDAGANVLDVGNKTSAHGLTLMHNMAKDGHAETMKIFIDAGVQLSPKDTKCGFTPLHVAARAGHTDIVKLLLDAGVDKNEPNAVNFTPLHCASDNGHVDVVNVLLEAGANIHSTDTKGMTALDWAKHEGHEDVATLLEEQEWYNRKLQRLRIEQQTSTTYRFAKDKTSGKIELEKMKCDISKLKRKYAKSKLAKGDFLIAKLEHEYAALKRGNAWLLIQKTVRLFLARKQKSRGFTFQERQMKSTVIIQKLARGFLARRSALQRREYLAEKEKTRKDAVDHMKRIHALRAAEEAEKAAAKAADKAAQEEIQRAEQERVRKESLAASRMREKEREIRQQRVAVLKKKYASNPVEAFAQMRKAVCESKLRRLQNLIAACPECVGTLNAKGRTILFYAVTRFSENCIIQELLKHVDASVRDPDGITALDHAASLFNERARALLSATDIGDCVGEERGEDEDTSASIVYERCSCVDPRNEDYFILVCNNSRERHEHRLHYASWKHGLKSLKATNHARKRKYVCNICDASIRVKIVMEEITKWQKERRRFHGASSTSTDESPSSSPSAKSRSPAKSPAKSPVPMLPQPYFDVDDDNTVVAAPAPVRAETVVAAPAPVRTELDTAAAVTDRSIPIWELPWAKSFWGLDVPTVHPIETHVVPAISRDTAALRIQCMVRTHLGRMTAAALRIQCMVRSHVERTQFERLKAAVIRIQHRVRDRVSRLATLDYVKDIIIAVLTNADDVEDELFMRVRDRVRAMGSILTESVYQGALSGLIDDGICNIGSDGLIHHVVSDMSNDTPCEDALSTDSEVVHIVDTSKTTSAWCPPVAHDGWIHYIVDFLNVGKLLSSDDDEVLHANELVIEQILEAWEWRVYFTVVIMDVGDYVHQFHRIIEMNGWHDRVHVSVTANYPESDDCRMLYLLNTCIDDGARRVKILSNDNKMWENYVDACKRKIIDAGVRGTPEFYKRHQQRFEWNQCDGGEYYEFSLLKRRIRVRKARGFAAI